MSNRPTTAEQAKAIDWFAEAFLSPLDGCEFVRFPVSFRYDGRESAALLRDWQVDRAPAVTRDRVTRHTLTLSDPGSGLQCRCEVTTYDDFPAVEWVAYFRNAGAASTPIISDIRPLDVVVAAQKDQLCRLHYAKGSQCHLDDFEPLAAQLTAGFDARMTAVRGRSSNGVLPFFNLEVGDEGMIGAIGWTGGWSASFQRGRDDLIHGQAGMTETHLRLLPGEEIRTPRILLLFWEQDRLHGHNMLRQFILAHHTPRPNGKLLQPPISDSHWGDRTEQHQISRARWLKDNNLAVECYWIDADWYGDAEHNERSDTFGREWYIQAGNWFPRQGAYPNGLGPVGDALRELDLGFLLWVEPERVSKGTKIAREHPEWLLGPIGDNYLFNLGIPEARQYLTDLISKLIDEAGITCYRQDFNTDPAPFWRAADAPDRVGMAEIRHIEGLYAFWDELLARHPGLIIDNCSSGGRRIDLEMISRSVPLWRSDVQCYPSFATTAMQNQTQGLGLWVPLSNGVAGAVGDTYAFRSAMSPGIVLSWSEIAAEQGDRFPLEWCRKMLDELHAVRPYFYGDFYPLVSYSLQEDAWAVWQFDRPDLGEGMILALRRPQSPFPRIEPHLRGLDSQAQYTIRSIDGDFTLQASGGDLLDRGIPIEVADRPGSTLLIYKRAV
jgi:alpha-galactosidase